MMTFKFDGDDFRKSIVEQLKENTRSKLAAAGLTNRVKVAYKEDSKGVPSSIVLSGSDADIAKAKKVLGIK
jgi:hypothetical protein